MKNHGSNQKGFSLVEVMVASVILILASQMVLLGASFAVQMLKRAEEINIVAYKIEGHLLEDDNCVSGTVRLDLGDGYEIVRDGWMCQYKVPNGTFSARVFMVDGSPSEGEEE